MIVFDYWIFKAGIDQFSLGRLEFGYVSPSEGASSYYTYGVDSTVHSCYGALYAAVFLFFFYIWKKKFFASGKEPGKEQFWICPSASSGW